MKRSKKQNHTFLRHKKTQQITAKKAYIHDFLVNYDAAIWRMDTQGFPRFDKRIMRMQEGSFCL